MKERGEERDFVESSDSENCRGQLTCPSSIQTRSSYVVHSFQRNRKNGRRTCAIISSGNLISDTSRKQAHRASRDSSGCIQLQPLPVGLRSLLSVSSLTRNRREQRDLHGFVKSSKSIQFPNFNVVQFLGSLQPPISSLEDGRVEARCSRFLLSCIKLNTCGFPEKLPNSLPSSIQFTSTNRRESHPPITR